MRRIASVILIIIVLSVTGCKGVVYPEASGESYKMESVSDDLIFIDSSVFSEDILLSDLKRLGIGSVQDNILFNSKHSAYTFRDVFGEEYEMSINKNIAPCVYDLSKFKYDEKNRLTYNDKNYYSRFGIDISRHIGSVNWNKVKEFGVEFVIIRLGFRGYGKAGNLCLDQNFVKNIEGAKKAGLDVGVYIYSQAINEKEAIEEAEFVLKNLNGRKLELPIVYDPESVLNDVARTDNVTPEQFTKNSVAFCKRIEQEGYEPMIYCNMLWEAFQLDLSKLKKYKIWYADYEAKPQTPYHFDFWQYSCTGRVPGINADVDLNIQLIEND